MAFVAVKVSLGVYVCFIYPSLSCIQYEEHGLIPRRCIINIVELISFNFNREKGGEYTNDIRSLN